MSSNGIVVLTDPTDIDINFNNVGKVDNFNEKLLNVLEEGLKEISESLHAIEVTIENKIELLFKD